jgi:hypothetical protein
MTATAVTVLVHDAISNGVFSSMCGAPFSCDTAPMTPGVAVRRCDAAEPIARVLTGPNSSLGVLHAHDGAAEALVLQHVTSELASACAPHLLQLVRNRGEDRLRKRGCRRHFTNPIYVHSRENLPFTPKVHPCQGRTLCSDLSVSFSPHPPLSMANVQTLKAAMLAAVNADREGDFPRAVDLYLGEGAPHNP